jgi:hypothetical protein
LKSCEYHSQNPVSSDTVVRFAVPDTPKAIIYICTGAINDFVTRILPTRSQSFILVSGDSDQIVPEGVETSKQLLENPLLIAWVAQNCLGNHPKLHRIPIGLDYHTLATYRGHHWGDHANPTEQESELLNLSRLSLPFWKRIHRCFGTFHFNWYASEERTRARDMIDPTVIDYQSEKMIRKHVWTVMTQYTFIPSPPGAGPDCHRTWEALVLGCIPIVKTSGLDPLFDGLPVWIVQDWTDITHESMAVAIEKFKNFTFNPRLLHLQTWVNKITRLIQ